MKWPQGDEGWPLDKSISPLSAAKAGKNNLNEENAPLLPPPPTGKGTLPLPPLLCVNEYNVLYSTRIWCSGPQTDKHLPQCPLTGQLFYESYLSTAVSLSVYRKKRWQNAIDQKKATWPLFHWPPPEIRITATEKTHRARFYVSTVFQ